MAKMKKWLAALLCVAMLAGIGGVSASAAGPERPDDMTYFFYDIADFLVQGLLKGIISLFPPFGIPGKAPASTNFYPGMEEFKEVPANPTDFTWELGFAKADLTESLEEDFLKKLFVTGAVDPLGKRTLTEILDPPMTTVTALSDGENGIAVFVSLDAFGITSYDVGNIRAALKDFAQEKKIISINVSALHQHSVIDTLGMNGNILAGAFLNSFSLLTNWYPPFSGKNREFMKHLTDVTAATVKKAVNGMEEGQLYYGKVDVSEYITDKRLPEMFDPYFHRLRFDPKNAASPETWLGNVPIHTTGMGTDDTSVSADWPYFIAKNLASYNGGTNFQMTLGAQFAMGMNNPGPGETRYERVEAYGNHLAAKLKGISNEVKLPAVLNIAHKQYTIPVDNSLHLLFFRLGAIDSTGYKTNLTGTKMNLVTEIGYMELGGKVAFALVPGEMEPALAYDGNGMAKEASYRRESFTYKPMKDFTGGLPLVVLGLTNDQTGYIPLPNDIAHFIAFGNEEINTASSQSAPLILKAFEELTGSVR